jgi:hypothetical protein
MQLIDNVDAWTIVLDNGIIQSVDCDFRLTFRIIDKLGAVSLIIEHAFHYIADGKTEIVDDAQFNIFRASFNREDAKVAAIDIRRDGTLVVASVACDIIRVYPNSHFEAWQVSCLNRLWICAPGGEVALFE